MPDTAHAAAWSRWERLFAGLLLARIGGKMADLGQLVGLATWRQPAAWNRLTGTCYRCNRVNMRPPVPPAITERLNLQSPGHCGMLGNVDGNQATGTTERYMTMITCINVPQRITRAAMRRLGLNALLAARLRRRAANATDAEQLDAVYRDTWNAFYNHRLTHEDGAWIDRIAEARRKEMGWGL